MSPELETFYQEVRELVAALEADPPAFDTPEFDFLVKISHALTEFDRERSE